MKNILNIKNIVGAFILCLFVSNCTLSDFGDTNDNPNATTVPQTSALLTNAISGVFGASTTRDVTAGCYSQYFAETQYTEASLYTFSQPAWDGSYAGHMYDLQNIIDINNNADTKAKVTSFGSNNNQIALARILKAYRFSVMTDDYGDIPYSEALLGNAKIKYDAQSDVYKGIFKELKEAVAQFDNGLPAKGDIIFNGNIAQWKKFANSWRLILALRISKADAALGKAEFAEALSKGVIESNDQNLSVGWPGGGFKNPWYNLYDGRKDYGISDVITKIMNDLKDPRLNVYGHRNSAGIVVPMTYGLTRDLAVAYANKNPDFSYILDASFRAQNAAVPVLTAGQIYLARAEAAQLGWTAENAASMYKKGIQASWEQWGVFSQDSYDAYITTSAVDLAAGDAAKKINLQRWLAFYPNGSQGWYEWRRTGVPDLKPTIYAVNATKSIPRRYAYPSTEAALNGAAYNEAVGRLSGGDKQESKTWWDK